MNKIDSLLTLLSKQHLGIRNRAESKSEIYKYNQSNQVMDAQVQTTIWPLFIKNEQSLDAHSFSLSRFNTVFSYNTNKEKASSTSDQPGLVQPYSFLQQIQCCGL